MDKEGYVVHFQHGKVYRVSPPIPLDDDLRDYTYNARYIVSDGKRYDLEDRQSVLSIEIPAYLPPDASIESPTVYLEYILQRKASALSKENRKQAIILLSKSNQLMLYAPMNYTEKDYYRIVNWLEQDLDFSLADRWKQWIKEHVPSPEQMGYEAYQRTLETCEQLETDLVEIPWLGAMSAVVAKYQGRVYSLSGKNRKYPPLPAFIRERGYIEAPFFGVPTAFTGFSDEILYKGEYHNALKISWRPFKDDRSPAEKRAYQARREKALSEEQGRVNLHNLNLLRASYPDLIPKSMSTIFRWRDSDKPLYREKFASVMVAAEEAGIDFLKPLSLPPEPVDPEPKYNGGRFRLFG